MLHRKTLEPVFARLDEVQADYFQKLVDKIDEDPRIDDAPNLIYLVLKETIPFLPTYLEPDEIIGQLFIFVHENRGDLNKMLYAKEYVQTPDSIRKITDKFITEVLQMTLENFGDGKNDEDEKKVYRVSWPYNEVDFPYVDLDDE